MIFFFVACESIPSNQYKKAPLSFEELLEIFDANEEEKINLLNLKGYKVIPSDPYGITYGKKHPKCESDIIYFHTELKYMEYYLTGDKYCSQYDTIKNEIENKGYLYLTTKQKDKNVFAEMYGDTVHNKIGLMFSILPASATGECQVRNAVIRFINNSKSY